MREKPNRRKWAGKTAWLLAIMAAAVLLLWARPPSTGGKTTAQVQIQGDIVLEIPLFGAPDQQIDLRRWEVPGILEVKDRQVRFVDVTCPDHICEKTGFVWLEGQSAVCLPNRAAVVIVAAQ